MVRYDKQLAIECPEYRQTKPSGNKVQGDGMGLWQIGGTTDTQQTLSGKSGNADSQSKSAFEELSKVPSREDTLTNGSHL